MARGERTRGSGWAWVAGIVILALVNGCSDESAPPSKAPSTRSDPAPQTTPTPKPVPATELSVAERVEAGRAAYNGNCIACHNMDPTKEGALGPAVAGASLELLEARVLRAQYPDGYEPKRDTRVMVALPHLAPQLPVLATYLDSLE